MIAYIILGTVPSADDRIFDSGGDHVSSSKPEVLRYSLSHPALLRSL